LKIGVISDIHGNPYALELVLKVAKEENVHKLLVLGDVVGYYYHPEKVMDLLNEWDYDLIKGNHEVIMEQLMDGTLSFDQVSNKYGSGHKMAIEKLSAAQVQQLINAPEQKMINIDGARILMCHGSNWDAGVYLYPDSDTDLLDKCNERDADFVTIGHSHHSFAYRNENSTLINVGSVGQSRSRGGVASWAIINTMNKTFKFVATPYPVETLLKEVEETDPGVPYLKQVLKRGNIES